MRNASRMARYMMMRSGRENEERRSGNYGERSRSDEMRNGYEQETEFRNGYGAYGNEGGNYARDNYGVDNRFRDRRGREHYDNGRFAPRNDMGRYAEDRGDNYNRYERSERDTGAENRRGRTQMNMIGFGDREDATYYYPTPWYNETEGNYGGRVESHHMNEMENRNSEHTRGGANVTDMKMTPEKAKEWVSGMHNEDGSTGERWGMDQVKKLMSQRGIEYDLPEVYAVMNSLYSDYCKVFKKYGFNSPEAYMDLALAWLKDSDAVKNKAAMYYECIVKH